MFPAHLRFNARCEPERLLLTGGSSIGTAKASGCTNPIGCTVLANSSNPSPLRI
jgi:hypothetical protein